MNVKQAIRKLTPFHRTIVNFYLPYSRYSKETLQDPYTIISSATETDRALQQEYSIFKARGSLVAQSRSLQDEIPRGKRIIQEVICEYPSEEHRALEEAEIERLRTILECIQDIEDTRGCRLPELEQIYCALQHVQEFWDEENILFISTLEEQLESLGYEVKKDLRRIPDTAEFIEGLIFGGQVNLQKLKVQLQQGDLLPNGHDIYYAHVAPTEISCYVQQVLS